MHRFFSRAGFVIVATCALLAACSSGVSSIAPGAGAVFLSPDAQRHPDTKLAIKPAKLAIRAGADAIVVLTEKGFTGKFASESSGAQPCSKIASWLPRTGRGPTLRVKVKGLRGGGCMIVFRDNGFHETPLRVTVTTKSRPSPSPSPPPSPTPSPSPVPTSPSVFGYTGAVATFVVPAGVSIVTVTAKGAQGGYTTGASPTGGGLGGSVTATIPVTPGESLTISVGGMGLGPSHNGNGAGGFNGGGNGGCGCSGDYYGPAGGGGGASDVREGGSALSNRVIVAGGGGGGGYNSLLGGAGGGLTGGTGLYIYPYGGTTGWGGGGTQTAGGAGGAALLYDPATTCQTGAPGSLGLGGAGGGTENGSFCSVYGGGGGGGGYYGGGGGGAGGSTIGAGGGGSGFVEAGATFVSYGSGQSGNGQIVISW